MIDMIDMLEFEHVLMFWDVVWILAMVGRLIVELRRP